jgi:hypothetical protein
MTLSKAQLRLLAMQTMLASAVPVQVIKPGVRAYTPSEMRKAEYGLRPEPKPVTKHWSK